MRIYIMTDMEGSAGILDVEHYTRPEHRYYDLARELVTGEVNAAIQGLAEAGAKEFLVVDGHGAGAIHPLLLDRRAELLAGCVAGYPFGCDASFDAAIMVGQHAKSNTDGGHLCHTGSFHVEELTINGLSLGEAGKNMLMAAYFGVPTILLCGDEAAGAEVRALVPTIETVAVKRGHRRGSAAGLDVAQAARFNLQAVHLHPLEARRRIRQAARRALRRRHEIPPLELKPPYEMVITFRADPATRRGPRRAVVRADDLLELLRQPLQPRPIRARHQR